MQPPKLLTKYDLKEDKIYQGTNGCLFVEVTFYIVKISEDKKFATILKKDGICERWYLFESRTFIELA